MININLVFESTVERVAEDPNKMELANYSAIFAFISFINHSIDTNIEAHVSGANFHMYLASRDIKKGE